MFSLIFYEIAIMASPKIRIDVGGSNKYVKTHFRYITSIICIHVVVKILT